MSGYSQLASVEIAHNPCMNLISVYFKPVAGDGYNSPRTGGAYKRYSKVQI